MSIDEALSAEAFAKGDQELPRVLTVDEGAVLYRVSRSSMYAAIHRGEIPSIRVGKRLLIPTAKALEQLGVER